MGQARGTIAGLEQDITLGRWPILETRSQLARFLEGPGPCRQGISSLVAHRVIRKTKKPPDPMGRGPWRQRPFPSCPRLARPSTPCVVKSDGMDTRASAHRVRRFLRL